MPLTRTELVEACGLSTVHVTRSLKDLRALCLIELQRRRLVIYDFDRLARESLFNPNYLHLDRDGARGPGIDVAAAGKDPRLPA